MNLFDWLIGKFRLINPIVNFFNFFVLVLFRFVCVCVCVADLLLLIFFHWFFRLNSHIVSSIKLLSSRNEFTVIGSNTESLELCGSVCPFIFFLSRIFFGRITSSSFVDSTWNKITSFLLLLLLLHLHTKYVCLHKSLIKSIDFFSTFIHFECVFMIFVFGVDCSIETVYFFYFILLLVSCGSTKFVKHTLLNRWICN